MPKSELWVKPQTLPNGDIIKDIDDVRRHELGLEDAFESTSVVNQIDVNRKLTVGITEMMEQAKRPLPWIIENQLIDDTLTVIYGPPKQYKTFIALDMALSQATGLPFLGEYKVLKTGLVIYVACEGIAGLSHRVSAWCIDKGIEEISDNTVPFRRTTGPVQICNGGAAILAEECLRISELMQMPIVGIYIDTLARNFGDGDENRTQDMNTFVHQCDHHLREQFQCPVVVVTHTGHENSNRARGSIVLMASADAQFRVTADYPKVFYQPDFMKDAEAPEARVLICEKIDLGFNDQFGCPVSSLVLRMTEESMPSVAVRLTDDEKMALLHLSEEWVAYPVWRDDFIHDAENTLVRKGKNKGKRRRKSSLRSVVSRVFESLEKKGRIEVERCNDNETLRLRLATDTGVLQP
tara:strand:- start:12874 stop:14100 length:1227 start_codon:yes stop_codon:yes gene_type:complete